MAVHDESLDRAGLVLSLNEAWVRRAAFHAEAGASDAYRLMDGRYEGAPGWAVDRYGSCVLIHCFHRGGAVEATLLALVNVLQEHLGPETPVFLKERFASGSVRERQEGRQVAGGAVLGAADDPMAGRVGRLVVTELGLRFGVDLCYGQNTGLFADARPARAWLRDNSEGRRVLNLFSYTAAFGVVASSGGARSVTNVDGVRSAIERGRVNYQLNQLQADSRTHLKSDVFDYLRRALRRGESWDGIILDPPPQATQGRNRGFDPRRDTKKLLDRALALCAPGGWILGLSAAQSPTLFDLAGDQGTWEFLLPALDFATGEGRGRRAAVLHLR